MVGEASTPSDDGSGGGELFGEGSVAAAEVEDLFAWLRVQEFNDSGGEVGDEAAVGGVGFGVPGLACSCWRGHGCIVSFVRAMREEDKNFTRVG